MKFAPNLYYGNKALEHRTSIRWRLQHGSVMRDAYALILPLYGPDLLEIYPSYAFKNHHFRKYPVYVVGLAIGREEAYELVRRIIEDVLAETGKLDIMSYFKSGHSNDGRS